MTKATMDNKNIKINSSLQTEDASTIRIKDELNEALFNTMRLGACRYDLLAAYKARKKCYKLCQKQTSIPDYKEYVDVYQLDNFPDELKKADYGKQYVKLLLWTVICAIICAITIVAIIDLFYGFADYGYIDPAICVYIIIAVISGVMTHYLTKKMLALSKSIRSLTK